jgi:N-acetylglutamate synthase-like GNAT family acetyltransferase
MFAAAWKIMNDSFPADERRSLDTHRVCEQDRRYEFSAILFDDRCAGCVGLWRFPGFMIIEHLAIASHARSRGVGTDVMNMLLGGVSAPAVPVVIEVEPAACGDDALRRIAFYTSLGFIANDYEYWQPAYEAGKGRVRMTLMTSPAAMSTTMLDAVRDTLYAEIYKVT